MSVDRLRSAGGVEPVRGGVEDGVSVCSARVDDLIGRDRRVAAGAAPIEHPGSGEDQDGTVAEVDQLVARGHAIGALTERAGTVLADDRDQHRLSSTGRHAVDQHGRSSPWDTRFGVVLLVHPNG